MPPINTQVTKPPDYKLKTEELSIIFANITNCDVLFCSMKHTWWINWN
jgi:hypothetical protein